MHLHEAEWGFMSFANVKISRYRTESAAVNKVLRYIKGAYEQELPPHYDPPYLERRVDDPAMHIRIEFAPGEILPNTVTQPYVNKCIDDILYQIGALGFPYLALTHDRQDQWTNTESSIHIITRRNMPGTLIEPYSAEVAIHDLCQQYNQVRGWDTHYREGSAEMLRLTYRESVLRPITPPRDSDSPKRSKYAMER